MRPISAIPAKWIPVRRTGHAQYAGHDANRARGEVVGDARLCAGGALMDWWPDRAGSRPSRHDLAAVNDPCGKLPDG
jgi:hypothetical protein